MVLTPIAPPFAENAWEEAESVVTYGKGGLPVSTVGPHCDVTNGPKLLSCWLQMWPLYVSKAEAASVNNSTSARTGGAHPAKKITIDADAHFIHLLIGSLISFASTPELFH